jgi:hypothetical protein
VRQRAWVAIIILLVGTAFAQAQAPRLSIQLTGPETTTLGTESNWQIQVRNNGREPIRNGVIRTELSVGLHHRLGSVIEADLPPLAPDESRSITLPVRVVEAGRQEINVIVSAIGLTATAHAMVAVRTEPLELHVNGPSQRCLGRRAKFDLEVDNVGRAPAREVRVSAIVPDSLAFLSANSGGRYDQRTREVHWRFNALDAGQRLGLKLELDGERVGEQSLRVIVESATGLEAAANATIRIDSEMPLVLEVADLDDPVKLGGETYYEIRVLNQGTCAGINVQIRAFVPEGLLALDAGGPTRSSIQGQHVTFLPLPKLASGEEVAYRIKVRGERVGSWRLIVQMSSGQVPIPLTAEETTRVYAE